MKKAFVYLHIAVLLAGLTGVFGKLITLNEIFLVWYRLMISSLIAVCIFVLWKGKGDENIFSKRNGQIALNGFLLAMHWVFFYGSIKYSNISVGVLCFCLTSFFTALLSPLFTKGSFSWIELILSILNVVGIAIIFHFDSSFRTGIILGIISSLFNALFTIFNERLVKGNHVIKTTALQMTGGALGMSLLLPLYLYFTETPFLTPSPMDLLYLVVLSSLCTVAMYFFINTALKKIPAFTANLSFNLEPIYSILIAVLFLGENTQLTFSFFVGLALIVLSLVLQTFRVLSKRIQA